MKKNNKIILSITMIVLVIIVAMIAILLLGQEPTGNIIKEPIKIGLIYPLTGSLAVAEPLMNGVILAVEEINSRGGINGRIVRLIAEDSQADSAKGISALEKLMTFDKVKYVFTTISRVALPLKPITEDNKILLFADIAHPNATSDSSLVLRHSQSVEQETVLLDRIISENGYKKISLLVMKDEYGIAYANLLKDSATDIEYVDPLATDIKVSQLKILDNNPDLIVIVGGGKIYSGAIKNLRAMGYSKDIICSLGFALVPGIMDLMKNISNVQYLAFDDALLNDDLTERYSQRFAKDPQTFTVIGYTDIEILANAITKVGDDPEKVAAYIKSLGTFEGRYETVTISEDGNINPPIIMKKFG